MAESGVSLSPSSTPEKIDMTLERSPSEPMDTDFKVTAADASAPESVNAERNEVAVVTSLRDAANMGSKETSVDESHRSEAVTPLQAPEPTVGCSKPIIDEPLVSKGVKESRAELLQRVQALKKDLEGWRGKLDTQVKSYREELGDLRTSLNSEVEQLRVEFQDLRNTLKQQTAIKSAKLDELSKTAIKSNLPLPTASPTTHDTEE